MSDFHRASLEMAWLRLCRITNELTEIENYYSSLNRELRWLWNSVYIFVFKLPNSLLRRILVIVIIEWSGNLLRK